MNPVHRRPGGAGLSVQRGSVGPTRSALFGEFVQARASTGLFGAAGLSGLSPSERQQTPNPLEVDPLPVLRMDRATAQIVVTKITLRLMLASESTRAITKGGQAGSQGCHVVERRKDRSQRLLLTY